MNAALRSFLVALSLGVAVEKAGEQVTKDTGAAAPDVYTLHKAAGPAVQAIRIQQGVSEGVVMKALQLDPSKPEDIQTYMAFERGDKEFDMSAEAIGTLAKTLKVDPTVLAAKMLAGSGTGNPAPATDPNAPTPPPTDPNNPNKGEGTGNILFSLSKKLTPEETKALNDALLKSQQSKSGAPTVEVVQKSADQVRLEKSQQVGAAILGLTDEARERVAKGGMIVPTDYATGGTLGVTPANSFMELATPQMQVLGKVQTVVMNSFKQDIMIITGNNRNSIRVAENGSISNGQLAKQGNANQTASASDIDLAFMIGDSLALQYQGNMPGLDNAISTYYTKSFAADAEDLGWNGTTDTYDGSTFTTLGKGWIQLLTDSATGGNAWRLVDASTNSLTTVIEKMDAAIDALATNKPINYTNDLKFFMSFADFKAYEAEYIAARKSDDVLVNGAPKSYRGHEIVVSSFITTGTIVFTTYDNLVFCYVNGGQQGVRVQRDRKVKATQTILSVAVDYLVANYDRMVVVVP